MLHISIIFVSGKKLMSYYIKSNSTITEIMERSKIDMSFGSIDNFDQNSCLMLDHV